MLPERSRTIMASGATAVKSPSSLIGSSAQAGPAARTIANSAITRSQVPGLFFPFSFVVPFMTSLLGVESGTLQEHRMCHGENGRRVFKLFNKYRWLQNCGAVAAGGRDCLGTRPKRPT